MISDTPIDPMRVAASIAEPIKAWLAKIGEEEIEQIKKDLSVDVEVVERGGAWFIVRSRPGEAPRRETGALQRGVSFAIEDSDQLPNLLVYSKREHEGDDPKVPQYLDGSPPSMNRPYMTTALARLRNRLRT